MKQPFRFIAADLGATSGRVILGTLLNGKMQMEEISRFPNRLLQAEGHYYWDIKSLFEEIRKGLERCAAKKLPVESVGVDTWGVDFVLLDDKGEILGNPFAYRDPWTTNAPEEFFKEFPREKLYGITGIQVMNFNSVFQFYTLAKTCPEMLEKAKTILFMPDAVSYLLSGEKVTEYTMASTSQLLDAEKRDFSREILDELGIDPDKFAEVKKPGQVIGRLKKDLARETGLGEIPVVAVAGHDTASAVAAIPARDDHYAYLSSGTWSLMGIETSSPVIDEFSERMNFTNEGGIDGRIRFLKNITGMWIIERLLGEWEKGTGRKYSYPEVVQMALKAPAFAFMLDPDDESFANPESMEEAIVRYAEKTDQKAPGSHAGFIRAVFESLALKYRYVFEALKKAADFPLERLHVIGGGAQNRLLNQFTANSLGVPVIAGPAEATALGNLLLQARAMGHIGSGEELRQVAARSAEPVSFEPEQTDRWSGQYEKYQEIILKKYPQHV